MRLILVALLSLPAFAQLPFSVPLAASGWSMLLGEGTGHPYNVDTELAFDFPVTNTVNYLTYQRPSIATRISGVNLTGGTLHVSMQIVQQWNPGGGMQAWPEFGFVPNGGSLPPNVRPYIASGYTAAGCTDDACDNRWWANATEYQSYFTLSEGGMTLTVRLDPHEWTDTFGVRGDSSPAATAAFYRTVANANILGLTFGGGDFFGHGVFAKTGTPQFQLLSYTVN